MFGDGLQDFDGCVHLVVLLLLGHIGKEWFAVCVVGFPDFDAHFLFAFEFFYDGLFGHGLVF